MNQPEWDWLGMASAPDLHPPNGYVEAQWLYPWKSLNYYEGCVRIASGLKKFHTSSRPTGKTCWQFRVRKISIQKPRAGGKI